MVTPDNTSTEVVVATPIEALSEDESRFVVLARHRAPGTRARCSGSVSAAATGGPQAITGGPQAIPSEAY